MANSEVLITIIVATYNAEKTLEACIQSIIDQTYKKYELIIIDGFSTDGTKSIIKKYDSYITKWISEKDDGIYDAWNKGIKLSKGDWIGFIGSDDMFYPDALMEYAEIINKPNDLDYISSKMDLVRTDGVYIKTLGLPWVWEKCRLKNGIAHPGSLHNKLLFINNGLFDTNYKICGDYELLLRQGENIKATFIDKVTVKMAQGGVSFNGSKLFKEHYKVVRTTGKLNFFTAYYYYMYHLLKYYIRMILKKLNIDI